MKRVERDPEGGWIARRKDGSIIYDDDFRWNSRSVAQDVVFQTDLIENERLAVPTERNSECRDASQ